jgi:hypothetical protein
MSPPHLGARHLSVIFRSRAANVQPAALAIVITFTCSTRGKAGGERFRGAPIAQWRWWRSRRDILDGQQDAAGAGGRSAACVGGVPSPDLQAALFFAFIILTDPPTSPVKYPDQLVCGVIVAAVSFAVFEWVGAVYYLLAGVLVGNVWEAWRRANRRTGNTFPKGIGAFLREITPWRATTHSAGKSSPPGQPARPVSFLEMNRRNAGVVVGLDESVVGRDALRGAGLPSIATRNR